MSERKTVLITGANRGIGLGLTKRFLSGGCQVYAAVRNPAGARDLWELEHGYPGRCKILEADVTSDTDLHQLSGELTRQPLDVLINNAGFYGDRGSSFLDLTPDTLLKSFTINTIGPIRVLQTLLSNLQLAKQPVAVTISSLMGSIGDNTSGGSYAYRMTKAAVNMFQRSFALDYPDIISVVLHPGWVQTDMGGSGAPLSVDESTAGLFKVISDLGRKDSGKFFDYRGKELPW